MDARVDDDNFRVLQYLGRFLNDTPTAIDIAQMREMTSSCGLSESEAFSLLLAAHCGLDAAGADRALYRRYFAQMARRLDAEVYRADDYLQALRFPTAQCGAFRFATERYAPYEAFVCDDLQALPDGRILPQLGFFPQGFAYPSVMENNRVWMTVTPNEIATMREPIEHARGQVLTYGLGLGYFAFHASQKPDVTSVTVVDQSSDAIRLFEKHLLPQFPHASKLELIRADAFDYAEHIAPSRGFDFVFTDLWHDVSDGLPMMQRMQALEPLLPHAEHRYWIERSICCYL